MKNLYMVTWKTVVKWIQLYILSLVCGEHWSLGVWLQVYVITKSIMSLRVQAHDILLNHDFHTSVHNMNLWPYMKIMLHSKKYCIMD